MCHLLVVKMIHLSADSMYGLYGGCGSYWLFCQDYWQQCGKSCE